VVAVRFKLRDPLAAVNAPRFLPIIDEFFDLIHS
jgi:hypothetical protein